MSKINVLEEGIRILRKAEEAAGNITHMQGQSGPSGECRDLLEVADRYFALARELGAEIELDDEPDSDGAEVEDAPKVNQFIITSELHPSDLVKNAVYWKIVQA